MQAVHLSAGPLSVDLDTRGAVITGFHWKDVALMRAGAPYDGNPLKASCFPLLPFGNRVRNNRFDFEGTSYAFQANQPWDRHYLHGDGWVLPWTVNESTQASMTVSAHHSGDDVSPYSYTATSIFTLSDERLLVTLEVYNTGDRALPFGLGLHPYFPLTPRTTLRAAATSFDAEEAEFLPGARQPVPPDLDFREGAMLPRRWINNGFAGWNGRAEIAWPERGLALRVEASHGFRDYFLFMSDRRFEPEFNDDYFCFEPMTHQADAHHAADLGGLVILAPGRKLSGTVSFCPHEISEPIGKTS